MKHNRYFLHVKSLISASHGRGESMSRPKTFINQRICKGGGDLFENEFWISFVRSKVAWRVDLVFLKPYWCVVSLLMDSRHQISSYSVNDFLKNFSCSSG